MSRLPLCTAEEFNAAVASAKDAFPKWHSVPVPQRARVMFKLQASRVGFGEISWILKRERGSCLNRFVCVCAAGLAASLHTAWLPGPLRSHGNSRHQRSTPFVPRRRS